MCGYSARLDLNLVRSRARLKKATLEAVENAV